MTKVTADDHHEDNKTIEFHIGRIYRKLGVRGTLTATSARTPADDEHQHRQDRHPSVFAQVMPMRVTGRQGYPG
jgi:hypothetical protein